MKKLMKGLGIIALAVIFVVSNSALAYDNFSSNTNVSGTINTEKLGVLSADISSTDTAITLEGVSTLVDGLALIGDELVTVSGGGTTIARAATHTSAGSVATTAVPHSEGDTIRNIAQNVDVVFTATTALVATDEVIVTIPNHSPNSFGDMGAVAGSVTDTDARTFTVTGLTGAGSHTVSITGLELPEAAGQYLIPVEIRSNSGTLIEMGAAALSWANQVRVRAIIQPALVFTIDKANIDITANPSVNDGENYAQKSVLTVATNALNGYTVSGKLEGKQTPTAAQLDSASTTEVITAGDSSTTEKTFGYYAFDGVPVQTHAALKALTGMIFGNTSSILTENNGTTNIAFNTFTNEHKHTVYYGINVDYTIPSGEYEGLVTYTATPSF